MVKAWQHDLGDGVDPRAMRFRERVRAWIGF
jgi:hypothetical protein